MGLKNCPNCGKLMIDTPLGICRDCYALEEAAEMKVVEFLRDVPRASLAEIHEATGVANKIIMRMIRDKRLFSDVVISYPCESCRTLITDGRVCAKCGAELLRQAELIQQNKTHQKNAASEPHMNYIKDRRN